MDTLIQHYPVLKQIWIIWSVLLFIGIVAWALWPSRSKEMERLAKLPLEKD